MGRAIKNDVALTTKRVANRGPQPMFVSYGGGDNSFALVLRLQELGIVPNGWMFAEVGGEWPYTYEHLSQWVEPWAKISGWPALQRVRYRPDPNRVKHGMYETLEEECHVKGMGPSIAYNPRRYHGCSKKWKQGPMDKWVKAQPGVKECWERGYRVIRVIGFDADPRDGERFGRVKDDDKWRYWYPLREWGWGRQDCIDYIRSRGFPNPGKSSCWFCTSVKKPELKENLQRYPHLGQRIVDLEKAMARTLDPESSIKGLWCGKRMTDYVKELEVLK